MSVVCGRVLTQRRAMRVVTSMKVRGAAVLSIRLLLLSPCRSVGGLPGEPSSFRECFGRLSWHIHDGRADGIDLSGLRAVMSLRYIDRVQPSTPWDTFVIMPRRLGTSIAAAHRHRPTSGTPKALSK